MTWTIEKSEDTGAELLTDGTESFPLTGAELEKLKNGSKADLKTVIDGKRGDRGALPTEEDLARVRKAAGGKEFQSAKEIKRTS